MRITGPYNNRPTNNVKKTPNASSSGGASGFEALLGLGDETAPQSGVTSADAVAPAALDVLLSLQEISDDDINRRKAVEQGLETLDSLEQLRVALLTGNVPIHVLRGLMDRVSRQRAATTDPQLGAVLDEVKLRAAVELAKLESAINPE